MSNYSVKTAMPDWLADEGWKKAIYDVLGGMGTGMVPLDIFGLRVILTNDFADETVVSTGGSEKASGGIVAQLGAVASLERENGATDKSPLIVLKANTTGEFQFPSVPVPPDMDTGEPMTMHMLTEMAGVTDTPVVTVNYFGGVGDTEVPLAMTALTDTLTNSSVSVVAANIPVYPAMLSFSFVPAAHTTDEIFIRGAWVEYTKKAP